MGFQKGNKLAGSRKGKKNKIGSDIKQFILDTAAKLNANPETAFFTWAEKNPTEFWTKMYGKCIPQDIRGTGLPKVITIVTNFEDEE